MTELHWLPSAKIIVSSPRKSLFAEVTDFEPGLGPKSDDQCKGLGWASQDTVSSTPISVEMLRPPEHFINPGTLVRRRRLKTKWFLLHSAGQGRELDWHSGSAPSGPLVIR